MTTTTTLLDQPTGTQPGDGRAMPVARRLLGAALLAAGLGLAWLGGLSALAGAAALAVGVLLLRPAAPGRAAAGTGTPAEESASTDGPGAVQMVGAVIPVWTRQIAATRSAADDGLGQLLASFGAMSGSLDQLLNSMTALGTNAAPGAIGDAVRTAMPELETLLKASQRAFGERDAAVAELRRCGEAMDRLAILVKQAHEIARHTRLVAFNASIEANRNNTSDGGNQAVALEMRSIADRLSQTCQAIVDLTGSLREPLDRMRRDAEVGDTTPEELQQEVELHARQALTAMLGAIGASVQTSGAVREASHALRSQLDDAMQQFQFGDRVTQMMTILATDMDKLAPWLVQHPQPTAADAAEWLVRLEASYTMDEQRSEHHGNVHIDRSSAVEFF